MISGQNSAISVVEAGNTSNATLASVTLASASVEANTLSAAATELPYVEFWLYHIVTGRETPILEWCLNNLATIDLHIDVISVLVAYE